MEYIILSNQFRLGELLRSETATRLNIIEQFTPKAQIINNLSSLCMGILDKVRIKFPDMIITSGYRCPVLNKIVGGVSNSQHIRGQAADITCKDNAALWRFLKNQNFDQLILYKDYIHVSYNGYFNRGEIIINK